MIDHIILWETMLGRDECEATEEEIAALEAEYGPFLPPDDDEG